MRNLVTLVASQACSKLAWDLSILLDCSICLNSLDNETKCITNCNHEFCIDCIEKWLNINKINCPLCRQQLKEYNSYNLKTKIILINTNELNEHQNIMYNDGRIFYKNYKMLLSDKDNEIDMNSLDNKLYNSLKN